MRGPVYTSLALCIFLAILQEGTTKSSRKGEVDPLRLSDQVINKLKAACKKGKKVCKDDKNSARHMKELHRAQHNLYSLHPTLQTVNFMQSCMHLNEAKRVIAERQGIGDLITPLFNGLYQGDMILSEQQAIQLQENVRGNNAFGSLVNDVPLWSQEIPFEITDVVAIDQRAAIMNAFRLIEFTTCLSFREICYGCSEKDRLVFHSYEGDVPCSASMFGRQTDGNLVLVSSARACRVELLGAVLHAILHSIGLPHVQSRPDREKHINIEWTAIDPRAVPEFATWGEEMNVFSGVEYDAGSVMHYRAGEFSLQGEETITGKKKKNVDIGQRQFGLSTNDVLLLKKLYC